MMHAHAIVALARAHGLSSSPLFIVWVKEGEGGSGNGNGGSDVKRCHRCHLLHVEGTSYVVCSIINSGRWW